MGKDRQLITFLFILFLVLVLASLFLFVFSKPLQVKEFDFSFIVEEGIAGFDVNTSSLTFGKLSPGNSEVRSVLIENNYEFPVEVNILITKEFMNLFSVESGFIIQPRGTLSVPITLSIPENLDEGNYNGKIKFEIYRSNFLRRFLYEFSLFLS